MPVDLPTTPQFYEPILRVLYEAPGPLQTGELKERVADRLGLSAEQRAVRIPSGKVLKYKHRAGWAKNALKHAGLVESPGHGQWTLTPEGRAYVAEHPEPLTPADIAALSARSRAGLAAASADDTEEQASIASRRDTELTPEERIEEALQEVRARVSAELLESLRVCSPGYFEEVVLDLLLAMGYGLGRDDLQAVGGSGDGGIDGIISLDRLGLEKVYIQAKRWQGTVGRPEIQASSAPWRVAAPTRASSSRPRGTRAKPSNSPPPSPTRSSSSTAPDSPAS